MAVRGIDELKPADIYFCLGRNVAHTRRWSHQNGDDQFIEAGRNSCGVLFAVFPDRGAGDAAQALAVQAQAFQKFMESVQGKLVVILPQGWSGSVESLLESLKGSSGDTEVVVLSQRGDVSNTSAPSSDDEDDNDEDDDGDNS